MTKKRFIAADLLESGWTVSSLARALGVSKASINLALCFKEKTGVRRRIEHAIGKPIFSSPAEFMRNENRLRILSADITAKGSVKLLRPIADKLQIPIPPGADNAAIRRLLLEYADGRMPVA